MSYKKDFSYRNIAFSSETPQEDFFLYDAISNLHAKCESNRNKNIKIRTVGILKSNYGCFYVEEIFSTHTSSNPAEPRQCIQVSMAHMTKLVKCLSMPYPVQLFGTLQWCSHPVIFAQIVQPLNVKVAIMLHETMTRVSALQSARYSNEVDHNENPSLEIE